MRKRGRKKQQEDEMWKKLEDCMASRETEENEHPDHENLANDTKQCDQGGKFGKRLH